MPQKTPTPLYEKLLSGQRIRKSKISGRSLEEEAESDKGRVLFSAPFRRLQSKAQVFALETNASVRSRLTHTLEVATVGRQLAQETFNEFDRLGELERLGLKGKDRAFVTFVDAACLIHDLGNPPFGHFGEAAISEWFHARGDELKPPQITAKAQKLWEDHYRDLVNFDGNPQGLRIVTHLQCEETRDFTGLNLTATTIAATIKYPHSSGELEAPKKKKAGFFQTEKDVVAKVWTILGTDGKGRHPLATLMEAADDVAYCISDIEDGIEKRIVGQDEMAEFIKNGILKYKKHPIFGKMVPEILPLLQQLRTYGVSGTTKPKARKLSPITDVRYCVLRHLAKYVGQQFCERHEAILAGEDNEPLIKDGGDDAVINVFRAFAEQKLYRSRLIMQREISAHATLSGLLDAYRKVMVDDKDRFQNAMKGKSAPDGVSRITVEASLLSQIGEKHREAYFAHVNAISKNSPAKERDVLERIYRIRMIVDFISGMTDDFALRAFQLVSGASTGGGWSDRP